MPEEEGEEEKERKSNEKWDEIGKKAAFSADQKDIEGLLNGRFADLAEDEGKKIAQCQKEGGHRDIVSEDFLLPISQGKEDSDVLPVFPQNEVEGESREEGGTEEGEDGEEEEEERQVV